MHVGQQSQVPPNRVLVVQLGGNLPGSINEGVVSPGGHL